MIHFLVLLVLAGVVCWFVTTYIPMPPVFRSLFNVLVALILLAYLLDLLGLFHYVPLSIARVR